MSLVPCAAVPLLVLCDLFLLLLQSVAKNKTTSEYKNYWMVKLLMLKFVTCTEELSNQEWVTCHAVFVIPLLWHSFQALKILLFCHLLVFSSREKSKSGAR